MLWRPPRRSWCMHRILCTACNRNRTLSFERGHDGNIVEEAYRGRYARQRLLNFWPESSCGYHAIKRFVCIIQVLSDVFGSSGQAMLEALLENKQGPAEIAQLGHWSLAPKIPLIVEALEGHRMSDHHRFMIRQCLGHMRHIEEMIEELDKEIGVRLKPYPQQAKLACTV